MRLLSRPLMLAWLVTGVLAFLVFAAAGPLIVVALKVSAAAAVVFKGLHLVRRLSS